MFVLQRIHDHEKMGWRHWLGAFEKEACEHVAQLMKRIDEKWPE